MADEKVFRIFAGKIKEILRETHLDTDKLQEVRMRAGSPLFLKYQGREWAVGENGELSADWKKGYRIKKEELRETLEYLSGYSMYAYDEDMKQGYLTLPGGHRVGLAGKIVTEDGKVQCIRHISFLNVRFSHEVKGCGERVLPYLTVNGQVCHTLIISPPGAGKTTLLRDLIRLISDGSPWLPGQNVGVADERSELGGAYLGVPQNDLGMRTDLLDGCPKGLGMRMLLRSMAPQVIAVDEIGSEADFEALESVFYCGCKLLATVHGNNLEDVKKKPLISRLIHERMFERYVILGCAIGPGKVMQILNEQESPLFCEEA